MLSVPPAFVLSQDQTLYKSCISISLSCIEIYPVHNACVITAFFSLVLTFLFSPISWVKKESQGSLLFLALFGFQDAVFALSCETALILYHIFLNLSSTFFKFFQILFYVTAAPFCWAAFLLYHIFFCLSSTFFNFFQTFFYVIPAPLRAALILYHLSPVLSSTFFQILFTFPKVSSGALFLDLSVDSFYIIALLSGQVNT